MLVMAKKKKTPPVNDGTEPTKTPRTGRAITFWLEDKTATQMDAFFDSLEFSPTIREYITRCIRRDLETKGFWPPPPSGG